MYVRTIAAVATDGRWSWATSGEIQQFESPEAYESRRVRDRFGRQRLVQYLDAMDIHVDRPDWFGNGRSVKQTVTWPTNPQTRAQALRRLALIEAVE
jgi:hypothetical protein